MAPIDGRVGRLVGCLLAKLLPMVAVECAAKRCAGYAHSHGPFISSSHPLLPFLYRTTERDLCTPLLRPPFHPHLALNPATMVVLIPSTDDIINLHTAYPQPALAKEDLGCRNNAFAASPTPLFFTLTNSWLALPPPIRSGILRVRRW